MEHKVKDGMIDNRMVKDDHQEGIARVIQRKGDTTRADVEGHNGSMNHGNKNQSSWKRSGGSTTPCKA